MADVAIRPMTADEFLAWHLRQERRYELVDGVPVARRATSATPTRASIAGGSSMTRRRPTRRRS